MFKQYKIKIGRSGKENMTKMLDALTLQPLKVDILQVNSDIVEIVREGLEQSNKALKMQAIYAIEVQMVNLLKDEQVVERVLGLVI